MVFKGKKVLAAFLEKDNCKLVVYQVGGFRLQVKREFAGQITFNAEVLRDGFIADPARFSSQIKMAFAQKEALAQVAEVVCFPCPDKIFMKTLPAGESADIFIKNLPYFREELIIRDLPHGNRVTYLAFEKKLIEDFQRPFLELGKKIADIKSAPSLLALKYAQPGRYVLLIPLDKEVVVTACEEGEVFGLVMLKSDLLAARLEEFCAAHNLAGAPVFSLGRVNLPASLSVISLSTADIYDLIAEAALVSDRFAVARRVVGSFKKKHLLLGGAVVAGAVLTLAVFTSLQDWKSRQVAKESDWEITSPVASPSAPIAPPEPEVRKEDYPVRVLNGTLVTGEAGRLADKLRGAGFVVVETKNATSGGFVSTRLRITDNLPEKLAEEIQATLLETYESVTVEKVATVAGKAEIEIIIGKKKR